MTFAAHPCPRVVAHSAPVNPLLMQYGHAEISKSGRNEHRNEPATRALPHGEALAACLCVTGKLTIAAATPHSEITFTIRAPLERVQVTYLTTFADSWGGMVTTETQR